MKLNIIAERLVGEREVGQIDKFRAMQRNIGSLLKVKKFHLKVVER